MRTDGGEKKKGARETEREVMLAVGSKAQKNSVACHGTESTPKIHSLSRARAALSHVRKVEPNLTESAPLDTREMTWQRTNRFAISKPAKEHLGRHLADM